MVIANIHDDVYAYIDPALIERAKVLYPKLEIITSKSSYWSSAIMCAGDNVIKFVEGELRLTKL